MAGVQQFVLSHTEENGVAEATVYLKCHEPDDVAPVQDAIRGYLAANAPAARCSFGVSGNVFDMIFAEREAVLTARLRSTTGRSADPEQLQRGCSAAYGMRCRGRKSRRSPCRRTFSTSHSPTGWRCTA